MNPQPSGQPISMSSFITAYSHQNVTSAPLNPITTNNSQASLISSQSSQGVAIQQPTSYGVDLMNNVGGTPVYNHAAIPNSTSNYIQPNVIHPNANTGNMNQGVYANNLSVNQNMYQQNVVGSPYLQGNMGSALVQNYAKTPEMTQQVDYMNQGASPVRPQHQFIEGAVSNASQSPQ